MNKHTDLPQNNNKKAHPSSQQRPEIRDNLDSREGLEQETKGKNVTHNTKDVKGGQIKK